MLAEDTMTFCQRELEKAKRYQSLAQKDKEKNNQMWNDIAAREGETELVKKAIASMQEGSITSADPEVLAQAAVDVFVGATIDPTRPHLDFQE